MQEKRKSRCSNCSFENLRDELDTVALIYPCIRYFSYVYVTHACAYFIAYLSLLVILANYKLEIYLDLIKIRCFILGLGNLRMQQMFEKVLFRIHS
jgi:hypothetical protein